MNSLSSPIRSPRPSFGAVCLLALLALLATGALPSGAAQSPAQPGGPEPVFRAIEAAWLAGDAEALAHLVQVDGMSVRLASSDGRRTEYSPSQAVYFFESLLESRRTVDFRFTRLQDAHEGQRAHGMAVWRYEASGRAGDREMRLVFLLTRQDDEWRISELNQISVR